MAKISESSFGNKLAKGKQILDFIQNLKDYSAPTDILKKEYLNSLIQSIEENNSKIAKAGDLLTQARATRIDYFRGETGAKKRCAMIRDFVGALQGGKTSPAYLSIQKELQKMNNYKKPSKKEEPIENTENNSKRSISSAETSFGSTLQSLKNVLEIIKNIPNYTPQNPLITVENFTKFIADIESCNQTINTQLYIYNESISKRQELYEGVNGLRSIIQSIKLYIAGSYGKDSIEYKEIVKIKY
ncbi:MAG: hypothetical protein OHK0038_07550 [Flammeovirgaceae bacterium]